MVSNIEEEHELLQEDENAASVKNPNVSDNRRLYQERTFHVDWDLSISPEEQPDLLALEGPVELQ